MKKQEIVRIHWPEIAFRCERADKDNDWYYCVRGTSTSLKIDFNIVKAQLFIKASRSGFGFRYEKKSSS